MWVLEACFDGEEVPFRKALIPGKEYHFGRKAPADLILADKTVSRESATIFVGPYVPSEEHTPPQLKVHAHKRLIRIIPVGSEAEWEEDKDRFVGETVSPDSERILAAGEHVVLTKSAPSVKVLWVPIAFTVSLKLSKEAVEERREDCNLFGIRLERSKQFLPSSTYFVVQSVMYTIPLLHALVSAAPIVTIDFVDEILRRGKLAKEEQDSLERHFKLPNEAEYFPDDVTTDLMSREESLKCLAADQRRKTQFVGTTLLLLHGQDGLSKTLEQPVGVCKEAGARIVRGDASKLDDEESMLRFLRRNKSEAETNLATFGEAASQAPDDGLVVVCNVDDVEEDWHDRAVHLTRRLNIPMTSLGAIALTKSIISFDARQHLNQMAELPQHPYEDDTETLPPTAPPPQQQQQQQQQQQLTIPSNVDTRQAEIRQQDEEMQSQRATTPQPTPVSTISAPITNTQASPRKPKRRADMARRDPLEDIFGPSASAATIKTSGGDAASSLVAEGESQTETQRPASRFRRNGGLESKRPRISETWRDIFESKEDPSGSGDVEMEGVDGLAGGVSQSRTKKYRQELDEADRLASQREGGPRQEREESRSKSPPSRAVQVEKETEVTKKRRAQSPPTEEREPLQQRQRLEEDNDDDEGDESTQLLDQTTSATVVGQLHREKPASTQTKEGGDSDQKFLQAMATSKRSKKKLDQFDEQFNQLRIVKPQRTTGHHGKIIADVDDPEYRAWEQMGPSDFDINAAGNFVQVDFVPLVYRRSKEELEERLRRQESLQSEWQGKPNFKKFRTKQRQQRLPIEMDVNEGVDYGVGDGYVRPRPRPAAAKAMMMPTDEWNDDDVEEELQQMEAPPKSGSTRKKATGTALLADPFSEDDEERQGKKSSKSQVPLTQTRRPKIHSRIEEEEGREEDDSQRTSRSIDVRLDVDADLDDSIVYRPNTTRSRTPASVQSSTVIGSKRGTLDLSSDEDDDESSTFSGFRKKKKA